MVRPYERLRDRARPVMNGNDDSGSGRPPDPEKPEPTDPVFPGNHIKMFNNVLAEQKLKFDRDENRRTAYRGGPRESDSCARWDPAFMRRISGYGEATEFLGSLQGESCA